MIFRFLEFELDVELYEIRRDGERLPVERRVVDLLLYLVRNRDRVISREEFLEGVWPDVTVRERIVDQMIYEARKVMGDDANNPRIIETIRGRGWLFIADVVESALRRWPQGSLPPGEIPFVGRKKELEALESALDAGRDGRGSMVLITGEPGIGKSRLIEEFADRASRQGARAYLGRCPEVDGAPPFWPWTQLLRAHRLAIGETAWDAILERTPQVGQLSLELDEKERWRTRVRPSHVGNDRFLLYDTITRFWLDIAEESPVLLLLLDDLHRADESSLQLLRYLAGEVRGIGIVVVGTSRPWDGAVSHEIVGPGLATDLKLERLSDSEVAQFSELVGLLGRDQVHGTMSSSAGGNPLLLKSLARGIDDRPVVFRRLMFEFMNQLPHGSQMVLAVASVVGKEFSSRLLAAVTDSPLVDIQAALSRAVEAGVVVPADTDRYEFSHMVVRDSLYRELPPHVASQQHSLVAEFLVEVSADSTLVAHHYRNSAEGGDSTKAFRYSLEAGVTALSRLAVDEGLAHLEAAERLSPFSDTSPADELKLAIAIGEAEVRSGRRVEGSRRLKEIAGRALSTLAAENMAHAALAVSPGSLAIDTGVVDAFAVEVLQAALSLDLSLDSNLRSRLQARLAMAIHAQPESYQTRQELLTAAISADVEPSTRAEVLVARAAALWSPGSWSSLRRDVLEAASIASRAGENELEGMAHILAIAVEFCAGKGHETRLRMAAFEDLLAAKEVRTLAWYAPLYRFTVALEGGDLGTASSELEVMRMEVGSTGGANGDNAYWAGMFGIAFHRGDFEGAAEISKAGVDRYPRLHAWKAAHGLCLARMGRLAEAETIAEQVAPVILDESQKDLMWLGSASSLGDLCGDLDNLQLSKQVESALDEYSGEFVGIGYAVLSWGAVDRIRGRLLAAGGHLDDAIDAFAQARKVLDSACCTIWQAYNSLDVASALGSSGISGHARRADREAEHAMLLAKAHGQEHVHAQAVRLRHQLRERFGGGLR